MKYTCDIITGERICEAGWFGALCDVQCLESVDGVPKNHYCLDDGTKKCKDEWKGPDCDCQDTDDDTGHYTCSNEGEKKCIDGWAGDNCAQGKHF